MREIMFRGYDPFDKQWHYGNYLKLGTGASYIVPQNLIANNIPQYRVDGNSVSQFTGLKDKNGKEIYEGDVLKFKNEVGYWRVEYEYGSFGVTRKGSKSIFDHWEELYDLLIDPEGEEQGQIVGNIHQHPDLLNN